MRGNYVLFLSLLFIPTVGLTNHSGHPIHISMYTFFIVGYVYLPRTPFSTSVWINEANRNIMT